MILHLHNDKIYITYIRTKNAPYLFLFILFHKSQLKNFKFKKKRFS